MKKRLDIRIHEQGSVNSRARAQDLIKRGVVSVNGSVVTKPSTAVDDGDMVTLSETPLFVSRGGEKLAHAISEWKLDLRELVVADIGSSTGGFTDCALQNGARKIYAIDVGTDQLDQRLKGDSRITLMEQTDVRKAALPELVDIAVVDLSFISLTLVLEHISRLVKNGGTIVALIKPQFEVGMEIAKKCRGVITDPVLHAQVIEAIRTKALSLGLTVRSVISSPIEGGDGNKEFLMLLSK